CERDMKAGDNGSAAHLECFTVKNVNTFLILLLIIQWFGIFICGEWGTSFIIPGETGKGTIIPTLSGKPTVARARLTFVGTLQLIKRFWGAMAGLSGRAEWVWKAWCWNERVSCDLLLAPLGPNCIRAYPCFSELG
ncbi:MAG: hypothetical protein CME33_02215, partial [Gimesia sp.]|uniref:hypothetical protein n=1 Tax=Gimesia sp. TaxID=2024833 RepID=UPI000C6A5C59